MTKNCSPGANQIKKCPKTVSCKECTYVQKDKNGKYEEIDPLEETEQTFFSSYFIDKPNYTVESIEVRLDEINMKSTWVNESTSPGATSPSLSAFMLFFTYTFLHIIRRSAICACYLCLLINSDVLVILILRSHFFSVYPLHIDVF